MNTETLFHSLFLILLVLLITMRVVFMLRVKRAGARVLPDELAVNREGGRIVLFVRATAMLALIAILLIYFLRSEWIDHFSFTLPTWLRWIGVGAGILSIGFWLWTQVVLDTQWSAQLQLTKEHHLITSGPYTYMRHPLYMALTGWCIAVALLTANWIFVALCVMAITGLAWRVPREEQMMLEAFGDEYRQYMKQTGRYSPHLWK